MNINLKRRSVVSAIFMAAAAVLGACTNPTDVKQPVPASPSPAASASPAASPAGSIAANASKVEALVGRWPAEGGAYLTIARKGDKYSIEIANADGPKTYEGTAKGDTIEFTRNGKTETIKAASGVETGMKGFEKETNCVVVTKGSEGFCKK
jgi:hypothetical protein